MPDSRLLPRGTTAQIMRAFMVPPVMLGNKPEPVTREDAARERIEYAEAFGLNPLEIDDDDVRLVVITDRWWLQGILSRADALDRLRPLQERISRGGEPTP